MDARSAYRESAARSATPVALVVMLYDQLVQDLQHAREAIEQGNIEERTRQLDHAFVVVAHLQDKLDLAQGGEVARKLGRFYNMLRTNLLTAQIQVSSELLGQQIAYLISLREAWVEVEKSTTTSFPSPRRDNRCDLCSARFAGCSAHPVAELESVMNENLERIQALRCRLQVFLSQLLEQPSAISSAEQLECVSRDIVLGGKLLCSEFGHGSDETLLEELRLYRTIVEAVRTQLPELKKYLLVAREQLHRRASHLETVGHWTAASKQTL
jgi:flagellar secretion chaperone FliS